MNATIDASPHPSHAKWWVLAAVACGTFMATLDSSIVNIALPTLSSEFNAELFQIKWVVVIYLLVITCLLLPFGRLSDQLGRKRTFQCGYLIFIAGSALCGLANSLTMLVFFRALQAIGAAMLMVNGPSTITATFPGNERGGALGTLAMVVSGGLISGPSIGGYLIVQAGWRSIFWVNIPIGLAGAYLVYRFVPKDLLLREKHPFDWMGAFIQMVLLISFIILFDPPRVAFSGGAPQEIPRWLILGVIAICAFLFIKVESEVRAPVFDLSLLKETVFWTSNVASFLNFVAFSSVTVLMPFFLEDVMGLPPHQAGLFLTSIPLMNFIVAPVSGRLSDRISSRGLSFTGAMVIAISLFAMAGVVGPGLHKRIEPHWIILYMAMLGLGIGLFQSPNNNAIMGAVSPRKLGVASAFIATVRNLGLVIGTGMATAIFTWRHNLNGDFIASIHLTHLVGGCAALGAMLACLGKHGSRRRRIIEEQHQLGPMGEMT
jgi:EmrB/QacA subfamily drug resistance transporter